ncbi:MAG: precorrin-6Y C5,15-methyltransferase (decarboxylating) subunit CbiT [Bacillota bacterium]
MNKYGLPDELFIRGDIPMTKSEIRALTLTKLSLEEKDVFWDIGAGTGSISIEASLNLPLGQVYAIEKNLTAIELIKENIRKFDCKNLTVIQGTAPDAFAGLPLPTKAVIGGSGGYLEPIINYLWQKTSLEHLIINAVTIKAVYHSIELLSGMKAVIDAVQVSVTKIKLVNNLQMLQSQNPIFIISAKRP